MTNKENFQIIVFLLAMYLITVIIDKFAFNLSEEEEGRMQYLEEEIMDGKKKSKQIQDIIELNKKNIQKKFDEYLNKILTEEYQLNQVLEKNKELKDMIKKHECGELCKKDEYGNFKVYTDIAGVETVCYGNTSFASSEKYKHIKTNGIATEAECEFLLDEDVDKKIALFESTAIYEKHKEKLDKYINTKNMYVDLIFNVGLHGFMYVKKKDGSYSRKYTNAYEEALKDPFSNKAIEAVLTYNKAGGKIQKGLVNRREKMVNLAKQERREKAKSIGGLIETYIH